MVARNPGSVSRPVASRNASSREPELVHGDVQDVQPGAVFEIAALQGGHVGFKGRETAVSGFGKSLETGAEVGH